MFTLPMRFDQQALGALDLHRGTAGELSREDVQAAQVLADVAAAYLTNGRRRADAADRLERARHHNLHDGLTGLPNRELLGELLERAVARARRSHLSAAVLSVGPDRFKTVNDRFGHHIGDSLLFAVAGRLSAALRPGDAVARLAGDEFVVLCEDLADPGVAELVAQRITSLLVEPFDLDGRMVTITASVGVAFSGPAEHIPEALLRDADFAMYQAKAAGGGYHRVADRGDRLAVDHEVRLEGELRHALLADQLELAYQPIVRARDGALAGVEALLRWPHPERGLIPPDVVVPMAERAGLILAVGEWVLRRACTDFVQWRDDHGDVFAQLAVNVSARQVLGPCFSRTVADVLRDTGMDPARLQLEVTESVMLDDSTRVRAAMDEIRRTGVQFSLDVFGMGYSCLFNLTLLPFDSVKIDCSSIAGVTGPDETPRAIIEMILELGRRCACRSWRRESRRRASWTRSSPSGRSSSRATCSASRCSPKRSNGGSSTCRRRDDPREQAGSAVVVVVEAMQRCS